MQRDLELAVPNQPNLILNFWILRYDEPSKHVYWISKPVEISLSTNPGCSTTSFQLASGREAEQGGLRQFLTADWDSYWSLLLSNTNCAVALLDMMSGEYSRQSLSYEKSSLVRLRNFTLPEWLTSHIFVLVLQITCGGSSSYRSSKKLELACEFFAPSPSPTGMNRRFKATDIVCCQRESVHTACVTQSGSASIVGCLFSMIHQEADWALLRKNTVIIVSQKKVYRTRAQVLHRLNLEQEENLFDSGRSSSFLR